MNSLLKIKLVLLLVLFSCKQEVSTMAFKEENIVNLINSLSVEEYGYEKYNDSLTKLTKIVGENLSIDILLKYLNDERPSGTQEAGFGPYTVGDNCLWLIKVYFLGDSDKNTFLPVPDYLSSKKSFAKWWSSNREKKVLQLRIEVLKWRIKQASNSGVDIKYIEPKIEELKNLESQSTNNR